MRTLAEALAAIPGRRDGLDHIDAVLSAALRHVQRVLQQLKPGVPTTIVYETAGHALLSFRKWNGQWCLVHGTEENDAEKDQPLLSSSRLTRAEVFTVAEDGVTPIERLIVGVVDALETCTLERTPQLEAARRLQAVLWAAGFPAEA